MLSTIIIMVFGWIYSFSIRSMLFRRLFLERRSPMNMKETWSTSTSPMSNLLHGDKLKSVSRES